MIEACTVVKACCAGLSSMRFANDPNSTVSARTPIYGLSPMSPRRRRVRGALAAFGRVWAGLGGGRDWVGRERVAKSGCISYARPSTASGMLATARGVAGGPDGGWLAPTLSHVKIPHGGTH